MKFSSDRDPGVMSRKWPVVWGVVTLAITAGLWMWGRNTPADRREELIPNDYHFRCTQCKHRWTDERKSVMQAFGGVPPTTLAPVACTSCGKKAAYLMARCPWCKEHYVHPHLLADSRERPTTDICPHCRKDTLTWRQK